METNTPNQPSVQLSYPTDKLVAIIDAMRDAEQARHELLAAGFTPDAIAVQHGTHAARRTLHYTDLDPFPQLARLLHIHSLEHEQAVVYEQALGRGLSVIAAMPRGRRIASARWASWRPTTHTLSASVAGGASRR